MSAEACQRCGRTEGVEQDYGEWLCSLCFFFAMAEHDAGERQENGNE